MDTPLNMSAAESQQSQQSQQSYIGIQQKYSTSFKRINENSRSKSLTKNAEKDKKPSKKTTEQQSRKE